jgi:hypothetical protein
LTLRGKRGLGDDGSEVVKRHPWFKGVDWESEFFVVSPCRLTVHFLHIWLKTTMLR